MTTLSFKDFSKGGTVSTVGNESQVQQKEAEQGPSLMSQLGQRALNIGKEVVTLGTMGANTLDQNTPPEDKNLAALGGVARAAQAPIRGVIQAGGAVGDVVGAGLKATGLDKPIAEFLAPTVKAVTSTDAFQKAKATFESLPQDTQEILGGLPEVANLFGLGVGKKVVTSGIESGAKAVSKVAGSDAVAGVASKVLPTSESIMQRVARIPKGEQVKFEKITGKSVGQFLDETGNYGTPDKIVERLYNDFTKSKQTADDALAQIQGNYKAPAVSTALKELEGKVARTSSPGAPDSDLARVTELVAKEKAEGLTMTEINEVKRIYERRVRLDYLKSNVAEDVTRANNVDNALRTWQFAEAEKAGLKNLPEINKFTQANKQLMDALGKEQAGIGGNNALGLTDAILLAGGSPESIASLLVKKTFSDKGVQSFVAKNISKNKIKTGVPEANFSKTTPQQSPKKVSVPSTNSTTKSGKVIPTKESKGIRGMVNPSELVPKKKVVSEVPKTIKIWNKSKFSNDGAYADVPVIRREDNITLYQGGSDGKRQFWTPDKKYAEKFGEVKSKTGSFYKVDNGNRVTDVYVEAPSAKVVSEPVTMYKGLSKESSSNPLGSFTTDIKHAERWAKNNGIVVERTFKPDTKFANYEDYHKKFMELKNEKDTDAYFKSKGYDGVDFRDSPTMKGVTEKEIRIWNPEKLSKVASPLEQEAKGKIVSSQNEWVKDTFWGKSIRNDAIETTIPISEIGDGKLVGIRQANVTDSGVKEWVARIKKGERPTVLIGNKKSGDKGIVVLDGNHRLEAYRQLGIKEIPIVDNTGGKLKRK